jgi:hypothetical protein
MPFALNRLKNKPVQIYQPLLDTANMKQTLQAVLLRHKKFDELNNTDLFDFQVSLLIFFNYSYPFSYWQQTNKELCNFGLQMHTCAISSFIYTLSVFKCLFSTGKSSSKMSFMYRKKAASALLQSRTFHKITTGGTSGAKNARKKQLMIPLRSSTANVVRNDWELGTTLRV